MAMLARTTLVLEEGRYVLIKYLNVTKVPLCQFKTLVSEVPLEGL